MGTSSIVCVVFLAVSQAAPTEPGDGWPEYFEPQLLSEIQGTAGDGSVLKLDRAYLFHRLDVEKISVQADKLDRCIRDRDDCEAREDPVPSFWDSVTWKVTIGVATFLAGVGLTAGVFQIARD